eukprot:g2849.t1
MVGWMACCIKILAVNALPVRHKAQDMSSGLSLSAATRAALQGKGIGADEQDIDLLLSRLRLPDPDINTKALRSVGIGARRLFGNIVRSGQGHDAQREARALTTLSSLLEAKLRSGGSVQLEAASAARRLAFCPATQRVLGRQPDLMQALLGVLKRREGDAFSPSANIVRKNTDNGGSRSEGRGQASSHDPMLRLLLGAQVHAALALANMSREPNNRAMLSLLGSGAADMSSPGAPSADGSCVLEELLHLGRRSDSLGARGAAAAALWNICTGMPCHKQRAVALGAAEVMASILRDVLASQSTEPKLALASATTVEAPASPPSRTSPTEAYIVNKDGSIEPPKPSIVLTHALGALKTLIVPGISGANDASAAATKRAEHVQSVGASATWAPRHASAILETGVLPLLATLCSDAEASVQRMSALVIALLAQLEPMSRHVVGEHTIASIVCLAGGDGKGLDSGGGGTGTRAGVKADTWRAQVAAVLALRRLAAKCPANQTRVAKAGGIEVLAALLRASRERGDALLSEGAGIGGLENVEACTEMQEHCAVALSNLAFDNAIKRRVCNPQLCVLQELVAAARSEVELVQLSACACLWTLAANSTDNKKLIAGTDGALRALLMLSDEGSAPVKRQAAKALQSLAMDASVAAEIDRLGGVSSVLLAADGGTDSSEPTRHVVGKQHATSATCTLNDGLISWK